MQVTINGEQKTLERIVTVGELLEQMEIEGKIAVELNREILPRSEFSHYKLRNGDVLEIVHAIGGG